MRRRLFLTGPIGCGKSTLIAKALGGTVAFKNAVRVEKGEGIEKKQDDFAAEIASMVGGSK